MPKIVEKPEDYRVSFGIRLARWVKKSMEEKIPKYGCSQYIEGLIIKDLKLKK